MKKGLKIALIAIAGFFVVLILGLQFVLNSKIVTNMVDKYAAEYIDGDLNYSRIKFSMFKRFPGILLTIDDLSITYPHERFAKFDSTGVRSELLKEGRSSGKDTLARFDNLSLTVNAWQIVAGRIRVRDLGLYGLSAYAHQYDSTAANWNIFKVKSQPKKSTKKTSLPWISVGRLEIGHPKLVYTSQKDTIFADVSFLDFLAKANVKISGDDFKVRGARLNLDSLKVNGRLPADTLLFNLDYFKVREPHRNSFHRGLGALANVRTGSFGRMKVPLKLDGLVKYDKDAERLQVEMKKMNVDVAYIPIRINGGASIFKDHIKMKAKASVDDCPLDSLLRNYADNFASSSRDISTDARLTVDVSADGVYSKAKKEYPKVMASVRIPSSVTHYEPLKLDAGLALDIAAEMTPDKYLKAVINELKATVPGFDLELDGSGNDLLGLDPEYKVGARLSLLLKPLVQYLPKSVGVKSASGDLDMDLYADVHKSEVQSLQFSGPKINGSIHSNSLYLNMPSSAMVAKAFKTAIIASSSPSGLTINADMDSIYFKLGNKLMARVRNIYNKGTIAKVNAAGVGKTTRLDVSTDSREIFVQSGSSRFGVHGTSIALSALKRPNSETRRRRSLLDSLQRVYPGVARNKLFIEMKKNTARSKNLPEYLTEKDFEKSDISFSLDSTLARYIHDWEPSGHIRVGNGFFASPAMPLRTRLTALSAKLDNDNITIDSLGVVSGTSEVTASAKLKGWREAVRKKGMIKAEVALNSNRLNVNELVAAMHVGKKDTASVAVNKEDDESFVTDTLANARTHMGGIPLIVLPANVVADVYLNAGIINYAGLEIGPASTDIKLKERTLQVANTNVSTNLGNVLLDAFYSTKTKKDLTAGVNLRLRDMSAYDIIHLIPTVDSMMPALKSFSGNLNCDLSATTQVDTNMNIIVPSLDGLVRINGENLEVKDAGQLKKITRLLLFKNKDIGHIDNLSVNAMVHDSKLEVFPFELGVDRYKLALQGMQGFDKSMYYHISILRSPFLIRFGINLFGYLDNWRFSLGRAKFSEGHLPAYTQEIDTVQVNIANSIRNIFDKGINEVVRYNDNSLHGLQTAGNLKSPDGVTSDPLSPSEYKEVDDLLLRQELQEQDEALMADVNSTIQSSYMDTAKLMQEYESKLYSKSMLRRLDRIKKQREKQQKKANNTEAIKAKPIA